MREGRAWRHERAPRRNQRRWRKRARRPHKEQEIMVLVKGGDKTQRREDRGWREDTRRDVKKAVAVVWARPRLLPISEVPGVTRGGQAPQSKYCCWSSDSGTQNHVRWGLLDPQSPRLLTPVLSIRHQGLIPERNLYFKR